MVDSEQVQQARAVDLADVVQERGLTLKRRGHELVGPCPICGGTDRFAFHPVKNVFNCRGCGAKGHGAISFVMFCNGLTFTKAVETLTGVRRETRRPPTVQRTDPTEADRIAAALRLWKAGTPLAGTLGERYLIEHRGVDIRGLGLEHVLRWHAGIRAVVALMTDAVTNEPRGVHRTFLNTDGAKRNRKMLGRKGVIRLTPNEDVCEGLGLVEGVEDGLAVILSGWAPVWAAADAGALSRLAVLSGIESLTIFADADAVGIEAARSCIVRWAAAGKDARISSPPGAPR